MKDIEYIKDCIKTFKELDDEAVLQFIVENKEKFNKNKMEIEIDNDYVGLYFREDTDEEPMYFNFNSYGSELLKKLFQVLKFDAEFV